MTNVIDAEWMKFMSRITRQMNCDAVDEEDDECDESVDGDDSMTIKNMHNTPPIATDAGFAMNNNNNNNNNNNKNDVCP